MNIQKLATNPHYKLNRFEKKKLKLQTQEIRQTDGGVVAPKTKRSKKKKQLTPIGVNNGQTSGHTLPETDVQYQVQEEPNLQ